VLGISIAALTCITGELAEANPSWKAMLDGVRTVATQACQVWGNHDSQAMGWAPPADDGPVQPNIWAAYPWSGADMSHLIAMEDWPAADEVRNISYYCRQLAETGPIPPPGPNPAYPASQGDRVRQNAIAFLNSEIAPIWPKAVALDNPKAINWDWVVAPGTPPGPGRFSAQYWTASVEPTERYVMSVAGSTRYRLTSETCGFLNLSIAGDWTINGFNAGCVEAAVTSGLMACRALTGSPQAIVGEPEVRH
ncbi:MAG: FAD-dependent oxidoreductase, partial [Isosphaeraceae bacterium]